MNIKNQDRVTGGYSGSINSKTHLGEVTIKGQGLIETVAAHQYKAGTISKRKTFICMCLEELPAIDTNSMINFPDGDYPAL